MSRPPSYFTHPNRLHSHEAMMERLRELTGSPVLERIDPKEPNAVARKITQTVQLPQGSKPEPPALEWLAPVKWADGTGYVRSDGGAYSVVKERSGEGWRYVAFHGINALGASESAEAGKSRCQTHFTETCG